MKPGKRKRHFVLNFFSCFLIPVYTISFAGGTEWFGSNFSVIAVTGWDHYRGFLYWGLLAGSYFFVVVNRLAFSLPGPPAWPWGMPWPSPICPTTSPGLPPSMWDWPPEPAPC